MDIDALKASLTRHEERRAFPYPDTEGNITIGVGHNLTQRGLSEPIIDAILNEDINASILEAQRIVGFNLCNDVRQRVIVEMVFNMGLPRLRTFKLFLRYISTRNYEKAAEEMLNSVWAKQVKARANILARMMKTGIDPLTPKAMM